MQKYNRPYDYKIYPGAFHGFYNEAGDRYNPEAAKEAWSKTLDLFAKNLKNLSSQELARPPQSREPEG